MEFKRYMFVDWNGNTKGTENVDDLKEAVCIAIELQCEIIDKRTPTGNQIVFSVWDGWNHDYDFYSDEIMEEIMNEIRRYGS